MTGDGINCGSGNTACSRTWAFGANLPLVATPNPGYVFAGWTGHCFGGASATFLVNTIEQCSATFEPAAGAPARTLVAFDSQPGDRLGAGANGVFVASAVRVTRLSGNGVSVVAEYQARRLSLQFTPPTTAVLAPGLYSGTQRFATATNAGLDAAFSGGCGRNAGRFLLREIALDPNGTIARFSADWELHCDDATPGFFGVVRFNSAEGGISAFDGAYPDYRLTVTPVEGGTVQGEGLSCRVGSGTCEITLPTARYATITAVPDPGYYVAGWIGSCLGAEWVTIFVNQPEQCAALFDRIDARTIRTRMTLHRQADGNTPERSVAFPPTAVSVSYQSFSRSITARASFETEFHTVEFVPPVGTDLAPGHYTDLTDSASRTYGAVRISTSSSCFDQTGRYRIRELVLNQTTVMRFAADYELHCSNRAAAIVGAVWFDSIAGSILPFDGAFPSYRLTIEQSPNGTIGGPGVNCGPEASSCEALFLSAAPVSLAAVPAEGYIFGGWTGSCREEGTTRSAVFVNSERRCGGVFKPVVTPEPRRLFHLIEPMLFTNGSSSITHASDALEWTFSRFSNTLEVRVADPSVDRLSWSIRFTTGGTPAPGSYSIGTAGAGFSISGDSVSVPSRFYSCFPSQGTFTIRDLDPPATGPIAVLTASFDVQCGSGSSARKLRGAIIYNSLLTVSEFLGLSKPGGVRVIR